MPRRLIPFVTDEVYHVFNRGIDRRQTFTTRAEYKRAFLTLSYYRFINPQKKLSYFLELSIENQAKLLNELKRQNECLVEILAYCFMPNHYHLLLKQKVTNGITRFLSQFQNSYTKYFNTKNERSGPLFLSQFKAVHIETDAQLVHVSRYIHLNPLTSFVVKDYESLKVYPWSSFNEYVAKNKIITDYDLVLSLFKNSDSYEEFVKNQIDYQRELHVIKHLLLEER